MKKQLVKKKCGNKLLHIEKVKAESEREESNDGLVLNRSQTPIQNLNRSILISEVADGNDLHPYIIPEQFKDILAQEWAEINVGKNIKSFLPLILNSDENMNDVSLFQLSVCDILTNFVECYIQIHMDTLQKEKFKIEDCQLPQKVIDNLDGPTLIRISERADFCRGLVHYFDTVFDKRLLYKSEKSFYKRVATIHKTDEPESFLHNGVKKPATSGISNPSQNYGLIHLLRLLVLLPELLNESGLTSTHIQKLYFLVDDLLEFIKEKTSKS